MRKYRGPEAALATAVVLGIKLPRKFTSEGLSSAFAVTKLNSETSVPPIFVDVDVKAGLLGTTIFDGLSTELIKAVKLLVLSLYV